MQLLMVTCLLMFLLGLKYKKEISSCIVLKKVYIPIFILFTFFSTSCYAASVTLEWEAPPKYTPAGYKLYQGTESGVYGEGIDVGNVLTYKVENLENHGSYFWAVSAYDSHGFESDKSNEVFVGGPPPVLKSTIKVIVEINQ